jgi:hypothetical protein
MPKPASRLRSKAQGGGPKPKEKEEAFVSRQVRYGSLPNNFPRILIYDRSELPEWEQELKITKWTDLDELDIKVVKEELVARGVETWGTKPQLLRYRALRETTRAPAPARPPPAGSNRCTGCARWAQSPHEPGSRASVALPARPPDDRL